uniref:Actin, cytoplasmic n=1 Tax=Sterkiella nova TaxID=200597 RepID=Q9XZB9_STENO|nr:actin [Sterkiella nova]
MESSKTIVIDNGSGFVKAGFVGEDGPSVVLRNLVGRPKNQNAIIGVEAKDEFIGEDAYLKRGVLKFSYPVQHGIIKDWDDMEKVWNHLFSYELKVDSSEHPFLISESPLTPEFIREQTVQMMFETFNVPSLYMAISAALQLHSIGKTTGIVCDIGDSATHAVPVKDGFVIPDTSSRIQLAGKDLTSFMAKVLRERGYNFTSSDELQIVSDMKEKICFVALDYVETLKTSQEGSTYEKSYELPDGKIVSVGDARFKCPEYLFQPQINGKEMDSIQTITYNSIEKCEADLRNDLYQNIVLSGGSSMFEGFSERLQKEIETLAPKGTEVKVIATPDGKLSAWRGGQAFASLSTFSDVCITKEEYDEFGQEIVHRKFI